MFVCKHRDVCVCACASVSFFLCRGAVPYSRDLATTAINFLLNKDTFRANIAEQLAVTTSQVSVLAWGASTQEGMLAVQVSVLPQSEVDIITPANVDAALAASNLTAGGDVH